MAPSLQAPADAEQRLRRRCSELRERLAAGEEAATESILAADGDLAAQPEAALELLYTEFVAREELGRQLPREAWRRRFPQWADRLDRLLDVHQALHSERQVETALAPKAEATTLPLPPDASGATRAVWAGGLELLEELGRGGMGVVYRARQVALDRLVAVKMILAGDLADGACRERFLREARLTARLQHPHIVQVFEVGEHFEFGGHKGQPFLVMEYVEGRSLADRLREGPLAPADAAALVAVLAQAIEAAHQQGIIHRDLKPANVLLAGDAPLANPKIVDFGLARNWSGAEPAAAAGPTRTGALIGTPAYMAPEQAQGNCALLGPPTDVYALGAVLYQSLTGQPPFQSTTTLETLDLVRTRDPLPPRRLQPRIPRDLETICLACLHKAPSERYRSAAALADDLQRFLRLEPIAARPLGAAQRLARWARRRPAIASLAAALVVVLLASLAGLTLLGRQTLAARAASDSAHSVAQRDREAAAVSAAEKEILSAHRQWLGNDFAAARRTLDAVPALRHNRLWSYLDRALAAQVRVLPWPEEAVSGATNLAMSGDSRLIAARTGTVVCVWDGADELPTHRFQTQVPTQHSFGCLALDAQDQLVLTEWATRKSPYPTRLLAIDAVTGRERARREFPSLVADISGDGRVFARCEGRAVAIGDVASGQERRTLAVDFHRTYWLRLSDDGGLVAIQTGPSHLDLWNTANGTPAGRLVGPGSGFNDAVRFSPRGTHVAAALNTVAQFKSSVVVWDIQRGEEPIASQGFSSVVRCLAYHPSGQHLAVGLSDATVVVLDALTAREVLTLRGHRGMVRALAFSRDGRYLASAADDKTVRLWATRQFVEP